MASVWKPWVLYVLHLLSDIIRGSLHVCSDVTQTHGGGICNHHIATSCNKWHRAAWAGLHIVTAISRKTQCMYLFTADDIILTLKMSHHQQQGSQDPISA